MVSVILRFVALVLVVGFVMFLYEVVRKDDSEVLWYVSMSRYKLGAKVWLILAGAWATISFALYSVTEALLVGFPEGFREGTAGLIVLIVAAKTVMVAIDYRNGLLRQELLNDELELLKFLVSAEKFKAYEVRKRLEEAGRKRESMRAPRSAEEPSRPQDYRFEVYSELARYCDDWLRKNDPTYVVEMEGRQLTDLSANQLLK